MGNVWINKYTLQKCAYCRNKLTVLHHNENSMRDVMSNQQGGIRYHVSRKKQNKQLPTVQTIRTPPTYSRCKGTKSDVGLSSSSNFSVSLV